MPGDMSWMKARYDELNEKSLLWEPPTLEGPNVPRCQMDGKPTIMLSANNYLNLTTHPKVVAAMQKATATYGAGSGSVRAIAGTMDIHLEAEKKVAEFKGVEASLIYSAGYTVNVGLIPTLVTGPQDVIISDELNHGSIIDGVRLTKASRAVYAHNDMGELEAVLQANESSERKLIITDGVFSMDGDIAPLDEVTALLSGSRRGRRGRGWAKGRRRRPRSRVRCGTATCTRRARTASAGSGTASWRWRT